MKNFAVDYKGDDIVAYNKLLFETFPQTLFNPAYLLTSRLLNDGNTKLQHGRGAVYGFEYQGIDLVLRHYRRGGIPAKFIQDQYFWSSLAKSRAMQEIKMLSDMHEAELPVPQPAAMRICRNNFTYTADIVTVLIPNAKTLSSLLADEPLDESVWRRIGSIIKNFHEYNCNHGDLNAHNIMLDHQRDVFLIDFDKSEFKHSSGKWQENNLQRLKRSLTKLANSKTGFNYSSANFDALMQGYAA